MATEVLDDAVLAHLAEVVCAPRRGEELRKLVEGRGLAPDDLAAAWRALVTADHEVGRAYVMHLIDRVELYDDRATVVAKRPTAEV
ncbi:MAG: hypothetical protein HYV09_35005 [Deltaproteobacteria bacterium]|nr:hypothetical protein [Deltaproteobacteria bacterium]